MIELIQIIVMILATMIWPLAIVTCAAMLCFTCLAISGNWFVRHRN